MSSRTTLWTGRVLSGIAVLFLIFDGAIKLVPIQPVTDSLRELGYPATDSFARFLGIVTLVCTALYAWPRTALLGAVLLTGLMGGAIASHLRLGDPLFSHTLFGVWLGLFFWVGLWLRDERVRRVMPVLLSDQPSSDVICSASCFCCRAWKAAAGRSWRASAGRHSPWPAGSAGPGAAVRAASASCRPVMPGMA